MAGLAWPNKAVRPYESLWCLTQRFLWLNRPSRSDLVHTIKLPAENIFALSLICGEEGKRRFEQESLRRLLHLSDLQWRRATLDMSAVASQTCLEMRFCRECLTYAYHTVVFQLLTVTHCPVHGGMLVRGCPYCDKEIPTTFKSRLLRTPFACPHCKRALAEAAVIMDSPCIGPHHEIAKIATWYRWVAGLPRAESRPLPGASKMPQIDSPVLPLLELAGRRPAPGSIRLNRQPLMEGSLLSACFGARVFWEDEESCFDRERRNAACYKSYRRHLQRRIPDVHRLLGAYARRLDGVCDEPIPPSSEEAKTAAFALVLFRNSMEGWRDAHCFYCRHTRLSAGTRGFEIPFESAGLGPHGGINRFPCSRAERQWLLDHFFCEAIRGIFAEALLRAREMVRSGAYQMEILAPSESETRPYSLGIFDPQERLEFWSLRLGKGTKGANRDSEVRASGAGKAGVRSRLALPLLVTRIAAPLHPSLAAPISSSRDGSAPTSVP
ncbi:MAG TPA: hypothetical protein VMW15_00835 [Terracidiphilus sp.]|nr:hypothetical protein [Terracidiphilus sp.]